MKLVAVRNMARADTTVMQRLGALGVSTVHEACGSAGLTMLFPLRSRATGAG